MTKRPINVSSLFFIVVVSALGQTQGTNQTVEVPFEFLRNQIVIQVMVDGKGPFNMLLDTGTDPSAVDLRAANEIGLKVSSSGHKATGTGTDVNLAYATKLPRVKIGSLEAKDIEAAAIDLTKISARMERPISGVLGQSFLKKRIVQIDYPKRVVRFYSTSPFSKTASEQDTPTLTSLSFRYEDNVLIDNIWVNGKKMTANFDTGSSGSFDLTPAAVSGLGMDDEVSKAKVVTSVGYNGSSENREGHLKNVKIGSISVDDARVTFFGKGTGHDKKAWGINIGNGFLKDYVVTIDYQRKTIRLERP